MSIIQERQQLARPVAKRMYQLGIPSHIIVEAFHTVGIGISTKTVINMVGYSTEGHGVRGFDVFRQKQTYSWTKNKQGPHKKWHLVGKITARVLAIVQAFDSWFAYYRIHRNEGATFDLDAILRGEKPP